MRTPLQSWAHAQPSGLVLPKGLGVLDSGHKHPHLLVNPATGQPLAVISDPVHLIKKLRNQLYASYPEHAEKGGNYKRSMSWNGHEVSWRHIELAFEEERRSERYQVRSACDSRNLVAWPAIDLTCYMLPHAPHPNPMHMHMHSLPVSRTCASPYQPNPDRPTTPTARSHYRPLA